MCKCPFRSQTDTRPVVHRVWLTGKYHLPALDPDDTAAPRHAHSATQQPPKHSIWTSKNHSRFSISLTRADAPAKKMQEDAAPAAGAQPPAPPPGTATSRRAAAGKRATCTALPSTHTHPSNMPCEAAACAQPPAAAARAATPGSGGPAASATPRHGDITAGCGRQTGHLHSTPQHSYTPQQHAL